ncbi:DNA primase [Methyloglobulus sp.]|uniref:DNA primase n=1 Tax=Methyloglobulus sp. TaxID=2518622 RepID=UPI0032B7A924
MGNLASFAAYQPIEPKTEQLLSRLNGVKNTGRDKWLALCPSHDDRSPSLSIKQVDDRILIRCFAGCGYLDVLAAIGLDACALFPDKIPSPYEKPKPVPRFNRSELFDIAISEAGILALGWNDLLVIGNVSEADQERVQRAYSTVIDLLCEVRR